MSKAQAPRATLSARVDNATADAERLEEALDVGLRALRFRLCLCFGGALLCRFSSGGFTFICHRRRPFWRFHHSEPWLRRHQCGRLWPGNGCVDSMFALRPD